MYELAHEHRGPCSQCGARTLVSTWLRDGVYYYVITCVECDAPAPDEPFAE
jgi:transcription elongation factor Elf1